MALLAASVLFFFALYHSSSADINWNGNNWALGCDFPGKDMSNMRGPGEQCGEWWLLICVCVSDYKNYMNL
jgi:hypothetical protein